MLGKLISGTIAPCLYIFLIGTLLHCGFQRLRKLLVGKGLWWLGTYLITYWLGAYFGLRTGTNPPNPLLALLPGVTTISMAYTAP